MRFDLRAKLARMEQIKKERPAYRELIEFYEKIYLEKERCAHALKTRIVHVDTLSVRRKLAEGIPAIDKEAIPLEVEELCEFFYRLLALCREKNPYRVAQLAHYLHGGLEVGSLLEALWRGELSTKGWDREAMGDPSLLVFLLIESLKPMYEHVAGILEGLIDAHTWQRGVCPVCGGTPPIGMVGETKGVKVLFCAYCGMEWGYPELRCPFCSEGEGKQSTYRYLKNENASRLEVCEDCNKYLKIIDTACLGHPVPLDVEHVGTVHLDMLAQQQGLRRGTPFPLLI